jgi:hypothetical protein
MRFKVKTQHYDIEPGTVLYYIGPSITDTKRTGEEHFLLTPNPVQQEPLYIVPLTKLQPVKD